MATQLYNQTSCKCVHGLTKSFSFFISSSIALASSSSVNQFSLYCWKSSSILARRSITSFPIKEDDILANANRLKAKYKICRSPWSMRDFFSFLFLLRQSQTISISFQFFVNIVLNLWVCPVNFQYQDYTMVTGGHAWMLCLNVNYT